MLTMTMRQRLTAFVHGQPHDRVPFAQYDQNIPNAEIWALLGRENVGLIRWVWAYRLEQPECRIETEPFERDGLRGERRVMITPKGTLAAEYLFDPTYGSAACREHFVKELEDYDILDAFFADTRVVYDTEQLARARAELGEDGIPFTNCLRTPYQRLWVEYVDIADLSWHFAEDEGRVMTTIGHLDRIERQVMDCVAQSDSVYASIPDNITASMTSPALFRRFCLPYYRELSARLAETGVPLFCHMDGDLQPLWDLIGRTGLRGLDSFSPQPDNDTSVAEAVAQWPQMQLAINYPSSVHLYAPEDVRQVTRDLLAQGGNTGRLMIQLSENVPPYRWRITLPIIMEEILAHGTPAIYR